jgi:hypothetical protein
LGYEVIQLIAFIAFVTRNPILESRFIIDEAFWVEIENHRLTQWKNASPTCSDVNNVQLKFMNELGALWQP